MNYNEHVSKATQSLQNTSNVLSQSISTAQESVETGIEIMDYLDLQKEQLRGMKRKLSETETRLDRSKKVMRSISRRMTRSKLIVLIIILAFLFAIALIIYLIWLAQKSNREIITIGNNTLTITTGSTFEF